MPLTLIEKLTELQADAREAWSHAECDDGERALDLLETLIGLLIEERSNA